MSEEIKFVNEVVHRDLLKEATKRPCNLVTSQDVRFVIMSDETYDNIYSKYTEMQHKLKYPESFDNEINEAEELADYISSLRDQKIGDWRKMLQVSKLLHKLKAYKQQVAEVVDAG